MLRDVFFVIHEKHRLLLRSSVLKQLFCLWKEEGSCGRRHLEWSQIQNSCLWSFKFSRYSERASEISIMVIGSCFWLLCVLKKWCVCVCILTWWNFQSLMFVFSPFLYRLRDETWSLVHINIGMMLLLTYSIFMLIPSTSLEYMYVFPNTKLHRAVDFSLHFELLILKSLVFFQEYQVHLT